MKRLSRTHVEEKRYINEETVVPYVINAKYIYYHSFLYQALIYIFLVQNGKHLTYPVFNVIFTLIDSNTQRKKQQKRKHRTILLALR